MRGPLVLNNRHGIVDLLEGDTSSKKVEIDITFGDVLVTFMRYFIGVYVMPYGDGTYSW